MCIIESLHNKNTFDNGYAAVSAQQIICLHGQIGKTQPIDYYYMLLGRTGCVR